MSRETEKAFKNIAANFKENSESVAKDFEMRIGAADSALSVLDSKNGIDEGELELAGMYRNEFAEVLKLKCCKEFFGTNGKHIKAYSDSVSVADTVTLARMIHERIKKSGKNLESHELLEPDQGAQAIPDDLRIVYRKAHGADIAFEKFASLIPDAAALYRDNFPSVCDSVALGDADMCILPYENTEDGKLSGFYRLIENYDLKIAASCLVQSDRREDMTRYLLLSRNLVGLSHLSGVTDFEFSLTDRNSGALTRTLAAAFLVGVEIKSIDTVRNDGSFSVFDIRITAETDMLDVFILYLKLESVEFSPLGLYAVID